MSKQDRILDVMIEFVIEELLSGSEHRRRTMVRNMAQKWSDQPALALAFAITSATSTIEEGLRAAEGQDPIVPLGYRLSALVSADIYAIQSMGQTPSLGSDLLHFWRRTDPLFLRLT